MGVGFKIFGGVFDRGRFKIFGGVFQFFFFVSNRYLVLESFLMFEISVQMFVCAGKI